MKKQGFWEKTGIVALKCSLGIVEMTGSRSVYDRVQIFETSAHGRVLEMAIGEAGAAPDVWSERRAWMVKEIGRHRPSCLVIDLCDFDSGFGNNLVGLLAVGLTSMNRLGTEQRTRILATGRTARELRRVLHLFKVLPAFGGEIFSDVQSALRCGPAEQTDSSKPRESASSRGHESQSQEPDRSGETSADP